MRLSNFREYIDLAMEASRRYPDLSGIAFRVELWNPPSLSGFLIVTLETHDPATDKLAFSQFAVDSRIRAFPAPRDLIEREMESAHRTLERVKGRTPA